MPPRSTNAPYSVMFLTTPWTIAPSRSVSISLARSSPIEASTTARRDSTTLLRLRSSLMTLNSIVLPSNGLMSLTGRVSSSEPGQEGADAVDEDREAALDLAVDRAGDELARLERVLEREPGGEALGLVARQDGVAVAVLDGVDRDRDEIAGLDFELALVVLEFFDRNVGFGLEAGVDDDEVVLDADHFGGDDFAGAHFGLLERILEHGGEGIGRVRAGWRLELETCDLDFRARLRCRGLGCRSGASVCPAARGGKATGPDTVFRPDGRSKGLRSCQASSTASTEASIDSAELSSRNAPSAGFRGDALRLMSRASRASRSARRLSILAEIPFEINCLCRRSARSAALAVRNTLSSASGKTTVPMSRPSATRPGRRRKASCTLEHGARARAGQAEIREAIAPTSSRRSESVTSRAAEDGAVAVEAEVQRRRQRRQRRLVVGGDAGVAARRSPPPGRPRRSRAGGSRARRRPRSPACPCRRRSGPSIVSTGIALAPRPGDREQGLEVVGPGLGDAARVEDAHRHAAPPASGLKAASDIAIAMRWSS